MPLVRLLRYYHAALWVNGAWTIKRASPVQGQTIEALFTAIKPDEPDAED